MNEQAAAVALAVRRTHDWFEANSGWAEPTSDALVEWFGDDVCQCPDECWVAVDGVCEHGLASWWLVLRAMGEHASVEPPVRSRLLDHAPNFRDIGGLVALDGRVVRSGIVYRSGVMDALDEVDVSRLRALGVRTVVDLRSTDEVEQRPNRLPEGVITHHVPVHDVSAAPRSIIERIADGDTDGMGAPMLLRGNEAFATTHADVFATVLALLTDPDNWPVVVHCTAGKDRTGFSVAALLWALGIDDDMVVADYTRSNDALDHRHAAILADVEARGLDPTVLKEMLTVSPRYLAAGRDAAISAHGSLDSWFADRLGVDTTARREWRDEMLEHPDPR